MRCFYHAISPVRMLPRRTNRVYGLCTLALFDALHADTRVALNVGCCERSVIIYEGGLGSSSRLSRYMELVRCGRPTKDAVAYIYQICGVCIQDPTQWGKQSSHPQVSGRVRCHTKAVVCLDWRITHVGTGMDASIQSILRLSVGLCMLIKSCST